MQRKSARRYYKEITLSSNQLSTRTRQPRHVTLSPPDDTPIYYMPRHLRRHLPTRR